MKVKPTARSRIDPSFRPLLRSLVLELAIYTPLVLLYFLLILRFANQYLTDLYTSNLKLYAIVATAAIIIQAVLLERLTAWLLRQFGLR
ncbi:MAG: hypothetical protein E4G99_04775 [Anaerolineales bacterium]|nr:MAG: hypothetical protein E4G99_04775 [Anaerolineales bacterium]